MRSSFALIVFFLFSFPVAQAVPNASQVGNAAIGGAVGGLLGNQVGNGRGKTIATAAGAVTGVVIASGCKPSMGTALGGLLGGWLGSQVGGGNGSNVAAGVGAGIGALLGSDCSPIAKAAQATPLTAMAPFTINGLKLTPMTGFPQEAFMGMPPIVTPTDAMVAAKTVRKLADVSAQARVDGNPELAVLSMYWAKRISATTLGVLSASLQSLSTNTGDTARVPSRAVVILPSFNDFKQNNNHALIDASFEMFAANDYATSKGVMVADNGGFGAALSFLDNLTRPTSAPTSAPAPAPAANTGIPKGLVGLPLNVVVKLPDGTFALQTDDALTLYNPNSAPTNVPLTQLDFKVRTAALSGKRQAAAPMMFKILDNSNSWTFGEYLTAVRSSHKIEINLVAPNNLVDLGINRKVQAYIDADGMVSNSPTSGVNAYKTQPPFKHAVDMLASIDRSKPIVAYADACRELQRGWYYTLDGQHAQLAQTVCFGGRYGDESGKMYVRTFFVGEIGTVIQTAESANQDKANQKAMTNALTNGEAFSDVLALLPLVGNVEGAMRCMGEYSYSQQASISNVLLKTGVPAQQLPPTMDNNLAIAKLAGWTPPPADEWSFDRVTNCVGAIPLAGYAGGAVKLVDKVANHAWVNVLSDLSAARVDRLRAVTDAFNAPSSMNGYFSGVKNVKELFPNNPKASAFTKDVYDAIMSGQSFAQASAAITAQFVN